MTLEADIVIALTTIAADDSAAESLARTLVERRVAACVSVFAPMQSFYWWQGRVETAAERQLVIKTTRELVPALKEAIAELHPYEVPELLIVTVSDGAESYLRWIGASVASGG